MLWHGSFESLLCFNVNYVCFFFYFENMTRSVRCIPAALTLVMLGSEEEFIESNAQQRLVWSLNEHSVYSMRLFLSGC